MKAQILQEDFNKGLALVSRVAATRGQLPILANVLIDASKEGLILSATNLEIGMRINIGGKVSEAGQITIPAKNLSEFVASLPVGTLDLTSEGEKLHITANTSTTSFAGISATEFPKMPQLAADSKNESLKFSNLDLGRIAAHVTYAAATDESRPVLTGIQFKASDKEVLVTATDGFRMSQMRIQNAKFKIQNSLILPARTLQELARLSETSGDEEVEMWWLTETNQAVFQFGRMELVSRVLEGNFPDVAKIIPKETPTQAIIDRQDFFKAMRTAGIFARENSNIVKIQVSESGLTIMATAAQLGENKTEVEAEVTGAGGIVSFNYKYICDFLGSLSEERVILKINSNDTPGVFVPEKDTSLIHLIMPVRLPS